jgi:succinyl-CoA synthetase beta subunit
MTWRELANRLVDLNEEQLNSDVTVLCMNVGECYPVMDFVKHWSEIPANDREVVGLDQVEGVLDDNHPYFTIDQFC